MSAEVMHTLAIELASETCAVDRLHVHRFEGSETLGALFELTIDVICLASAPSPTDVLGCALTVTVTRDGMLVRQWHGMVSAVVVRGTDADGALHYVLTFVPRAWRLTTVTTQDIYMGMRLPELLRSKLAKVGLERDSEFRLIERYPVLEFVVQYRETDLAFVLRLCEQYGLTLRIEHRAKREVVVISDHNGGFDDARALHWRTSDLGGDVDEIEMTQKLLPRWYGVYDYNYRAPTLELSGIAGTDGYAGGTTEYGVHVKTPEEAQRLANVRADEERGKGTTFRGRAHRFDLTPGSIHLLRDAPSWFEHDRLLVTVVRYETLTSPTGAPKHGCTFEAQPTGHPFRPARVTPRPRIHGVLSGVVEGEPGTPEGGTAQLDRAGRYVVRFHFDTAGPGERKASRPVRMAQPYAGPGQGMHFPLRPGTEVLLSFVDGDPDRPIIVGAVPNVATTSPVAAETSNRNRIVTASGVMFEIVDGR